MSRSPCVASSLKSFLPIKDFKSPNHHLKLSPIPVAHTQYRATLSPFPQCNSQPLFSTLSPNHFSLSSPNNLLQKCDPVSLSVDSPHRLLFASKIKTSHTSSNLLGRGRFGQVVLAKYKGTSSLMKPLKIPYYQ